MGSTGPSEVPLGEAPDVVAEEAAAAAEPPESKNYSEATIPPVDTADADSEGSDELDDWEWIRHHDVEVTVMPPRDSARPDEWRARREALEKKLSDWEASPEGIALNAEVDALLARSYRALGLSSAVGELDFPERAALMFKVDNGGPVASGRLPAVKIVTKEMLHDAWKAMEACMKERGRALSRAYGNFDKYVGLGWLLGDVMCGRLIDGTDAYRIGRKLGKVAPDLKAEFDAPLRRVGKRKYSDDSARELDRAAAAREEAEVRREPVDVGLEEEAAALVASTAAPAAQRAGTSDMPPPPPPPPPRLPPAPAPPRNPERLERLKLLREAETLVSNAEGAFAAAVRARDQAKAVWEHAREHYSNPHRSAQIPEERWAAWDKQEKSALEAARVRYTAAERAIGEPEQALYWAKFEAKEARIELDEYEKAQRREARQQLHEAQEAEKWVQIKEMITENHTLYAPTDPEYWEPDAWEYAQIHRMWKLL